METTNHTSSTSKVPAQGPPDLGEARGGVGRMLLSRLSTKDASLALAAIGLLWLILINELRIAWSANPQYSYGWVVPFLCLGLLLRRWQAAREEISSGHWSAAGISAHAKPSSRQFVHLFSFQHFIFLFRRLPHPPSSSCFGSKSKLAHPGLAAGVLRHRPKLDDRLAIVGSRLGTPIRFSGLLYPDSGGMAAKH